MANMLVRHKISDYANWKSVFDEHGATRKAMGCKGGQILRNADNPNEIIVLLEWDDVKKAREFAESPTL